MGLTLECTPINKHLAVLRYNNGAGARVISNPYEATKAYVIAAAEGKLSKWLPYTISVIELPEDDPEYCPQGFNLGRWRCRLTDDNSPHPVRFSANPVLFRQLVEPLDFSKPFDEELVEGIRKQFISGRVKVEVDAVEITEAENE